MEFYASCPSGLENALADELRALKLPQVRRLKGRVSFAGALRDAYTACMWSRLASRVLCVLGRVPAHDADELYRSMRDIAWEHILKPGATISITARGGNDHLHNTHFIALKVKDAVCDRIMAVAGVRPQVDTDAPDAHLVVSVRNGRASISIDLSGEPLFKRLPRAATRPAPGKAHVLRPDYAALVLACAGWASAVQSADADEVTPVLIDLSCAGGGLLLEAVDILEHRAPGLARRTWGFEGWAEHDEEVWSAVAADAAQRFEAGRDRPGRIIACDVDTHAVERARSILVAEGRAGRVAFTEADPDVVLAAAHIHPDTPGGIVADTTETPLGDIPALVALAASVRCAPAAAHLPWSILSRDRLVAERLGAEPDRTIEVRPNNEAASLDMLGKDAEMPEGEAKTADASPSVTPPATVDIGDGHPIPVMLAESQQFAFRLKKVARLRRRWAKREGVSCYRVYDADLPEYAAAIDLYTGSAATPGRWLVIAEYAAPKTIDPAVAQARMLDMLAIAPRVLDVEPSCVFAKTRARSRGGSQYGKRDKAAGGAKATAPLIEEGGLTFAVNFDDYLDTGIFLDHRTTRSLVREHAKGARWFLNLFAYTGTATCYAADAGVEETVTVDLSNTYLDWAERNMQLNGFTGPEHHYVRADVMDWMRDMRHTANRWDLIFCDPPTFSNSAKMGRRTFDVQRDHVELLRGVAGLLTPGGEAIFSCNLRSFKPDVARLAAAGVALTDITAETIPEDFARNPRIHRCYLVRRA